MNENEMIESIQESLEETKNLFDLLLCTQDKDAIDMDEVKNGMTLADLGEKLGILEKYEDEVYYINKPERFEEIKHLYEYLCDNIDDLMEGWLSGLKRLS